MAAIPIIQDLLFSSFDKETSFQIISVIIIDGGMREKPTVMSKGGGNYEQWEWGRILMNKPFPALLPTTVAY